MTAFTYVFAFVLMLSVLIFVHELGHFLVARWCGVRVLKFCLGFGPPIGIGRWRLAWTRNGTEYAIAWFPLGGFVKMLGENPDEADDPEVRAHPSEALGAKPLWQKLAIVFAGPAMNLMLPVVIFAVTLFIGMPRPAPVVGAVEAGSPAERAGLAAGDRLLALGDQPDRVVGRFRGARAQAPGRGARAALPARRRAARGALRGHLPRGARRVRQGARHGLGGARPSPAHRDGRRPERGRARRTARGCAPAT